MDEIKIREILRQYNQEQLLAFYDELNSSDKQALLKDIENIDFEKIKAFNETQVIKESIDTFEPIERITKEELTSSEKTRLSKIGREIIESGKYAVVTMAGGQGTRLGHTGPKGTYKLQLKDKTRYIFEIFTDYLKNAYAKYNVYIPWYIMTSEANNDETVAFFENNHYFGYSKDKIKFFKQGELPITDLDGKVLLEEKHRVLKAADGNGGIFNAMAKNNIIIDMKANGVQWVLITGIDNILVNIADDIYIGLVSDENRLNGVKSVAKTSPTESVGVFCKRNGKPGVVEYSEMDDKMRYALNENGELKYMEANIVNHLINIEVLEKINKISMPIHKAIKKQTYLDKLGNKVTSYKPDTIKYEAFIFDYFKMVDDVTVYRVKREEEFAPVKNKEGADSPETATKLYNDLFFKED